MKENRHGEFVWEDHAMIQAHGSRHKGEMIMYKNN
jgi:hypothetical protein